MREHYLDAHGLPDWRGATYAYKRAVSSIYASAGLDRAAQATISAAIRYHVSAAVRERLDDETLDDLGLRRTSFRERSVAKREQQSALISALSPTPSDDAPAMKLHPLRAATGAYTLLSRITAEEVADLSPGVAARLQELVEDIADEVDRLREG